MADQNQPELDAETLRKIEEEVQAQFANHEPELDEETLKQIEAQVAAEFESSTPAEEPLPYEPPPVYEQPQISPPPSSFFTPNVAPAQPAPAGFDPEATTVDEPVTDLSDQPTDLNISTGFEEPQVYQQPQTYEQPMAYQQPQEYEQPQIHVQPMAQQPIYEEQPYEQSVYEEPAAASQANLSTGKKKKLKAGGKTRMNMSATGPGGRSRVKTRVDFDDEPEEEISRSTRAGARRTGRRRVQEEPKKSNTGLIIGIALGAIVIIAVVLVMVMGGKKAEPKQEEAVKEPEKPLVKEEPEPPKEKTYATGAYNTQDFRTMVLGLISSKKLDDAEIWIKSRKKDAPNEDLGYLEKRLRLARGQ